MEDQTFYRIECSCGQVITSYGTPDEHRDEAYAHLMFVHGVTQWDEEGVDELYGDTDSQS